jgi:predicted nucleic acid-binding protein
LVFDGLEARRCAKAMGLRVIGTLGVVGRAKAIGRIAEPRPVVEHLRRTGLYASDALVQHILREVGE